MNILHNSHNRLFRNPFGAVFCGAPIVLRLRLEGCARPRAWLRLWGEGQELRLPLRLADASEKDALLLEAELHAPETPCLLWYSFLIEQDGDLYCYGSAPERGGRGLLHGPLSRPEDAKALPAFQITVAARESASPEWYTRGILYQIFVDRFHPGSGPRWQDAPSGTGALLHTSWEDTPFYIKDEQGRVERWSFFGGNLEGVCQKLSYLRSLGVSALYLNPIFESSSNHKYDTGDYLRIDPMFGGEEQFAALLREAEAQGISVILDGVFSHTGADSRYFNRYGRYPELGAYQSPDSPYASWYRFHRFPDQYECWWGVDALPNVNELAPSYLDFICDGENSVIRTWVRQGVKGFRLDVADELPDEFIRHLRRAMTEENPEAVLIGEVWEDASNKVSYGAQRRYFAGDELHAVTNYPFRDLLLGFLLGRLEAEQLEAGLLRLKENYPKPNFMAAMNLTGSHDRIRTLTLLGEAPAEETLRERERRDFRLDGQARALALRRMEPLVLYQMACPGVPCVYYGDEAGLEGYSDPYNRAPYPWSREEEALISLYRRRARLRNEYEVFTRGDFLPFSQGGDVAGFWRVLPDGPMGEERAAILINRSGENREVTLAGPVLRPLPERSHAEMLEWPEKTRWDLFDLDSGAVERGLPLSCTPYRLTLPPFGARALLLRPARTLPRLFSEAPRRAGVLLPLSALPSPWEIGGWGKPAHTFVDSLAAAGQSVWQLLPLNPLGEGDSPYQSESAFALNPLYLCPEALCAFLEEGEQSAIAPLRRLISQEETCRPAGSPDHIDYEAAAAQKERILRAAFLCWEQGGQRLTAAEDYRSFVRENAYWLPDYTLFKALRAESGNLPWTQWPRAYRDRETAALAAARLRLAREIAYHSFLQYLADRQQRALRGYAKARGLSLMGDLPIFVAADSADCWAHQELFWLDGEGKPSVVAGVPPDYFNADGQRWGNPHYRWERMEKDGYAWWQARLRQALRHFDLFRLDHFRGFEAFWQIDAKEQTARHGYWMKGPGLRFFQRLTEALGPLPLIAEDLGFLTPEVETLKQHFGYAGMKVLPFAYPDLSGGEATVYYSGTHDNDTLLGYLETELAPEATAREREALARRLMEQLLNTQSALVVFPAQDVLGLGTEARMNVPGLPRGNWAWRMRPPGEAERERWAWLGEQTSASGRFHPAQSIES